MAEKLSFALRGVFGTKLYKNLKDPKVVFERVMNPTDDVRVMAFSNFGEYFAFCDSLNTCLVDAETGEIVFQRELPKPTIFVFSPKDTYFVTWEPYVIYGLRRNKEGDVKTPKPNLNFFSVKDRTHITTFIARKKEEIPHWTQDEKYMVRLAGSEVWVHDGKDLEGHKFKTVIQNVQSIELSPSTTEYTLAAFIPSIRGEPARVELRRLFEELPIAKTLTLMTCDKVNMSWNSRGAHLLVLATQEVDTSGRSYYGRSFLTLISINGESIRINFDKEGSIHDFKWNPLGHQFAVVYGFMPAKVAIYNLIGSVVWDLGEGSRNEVYYNPQGNIMLTCGFGSLSGGKIQIWDTEKQKEVNNIEVPNTTHLGFSPDGQYFYTAITAPRMRVDNSYRLWHFTGKQVYEFVPEKYELWEVQFRSIPASLVPPKFTIPVLSKDEKAATGVPVKLADGKAVAAGAIKKAGAYIPPNLRKAGSNEGALKPVGSAVVVKSENEKKIRKIKKTLNEIKALKDKQARGENLEKNQLEKLSKEAELTKQLEELNSSTSGS